MLRSANMYTVLDCCGCGSLFKPACPDCGLLHMNKLSAAPTTPNIMSDKVENQMSASCEDLRSILRRIIDELPTKRNWLDPDLEKAARAALASSRADHSALAFLLCAAKRLNESKPVRNLDEIFAFAESTLAASSRAPEGAELNRNEKLDALWLTMLAHAHSEGAQEIGANSPPHRRSQRDLKENHNDSTKPH